MVEQFIEYELMILDGIQALMGNGLFDWFFAWISFLGNGGSIWILLALGLIYFPKTRQLGILCFIGLVFSGIFTNMILKNLIARPRPFMYNEYPILIEAPLDHSFPSGHTSLAFTYAFIVWQSKLIIGKVRVRLPLMIFAVLMAFSRLYLYVHFPTDVIAGIMVGYLYSRMAIQSYVIVNKRSE